MALATPTSLLPQAFASAGAKNVIPVGTAAPLASLYDGFPAITMQPLGSGGVPPAGADFNGILNWITTLLAWTNAGGLYPFNSALSTALGGYNKGAVLILNDGATIVRSTANTNTEDPNTPATVSAWTEIAISATAVQKEWMHNMHAPTTGIEIDDTNATDHYIFTVVSGVLTQTTV